MRFLRGSALDQLADVLRRAEVTWQAHSVQEWSALREPEQQEWRALARAAANAAYEELSAEEGRVSAD